MEELPLFNVRENARATDPVTSVMAAEAIAPFVHAGQMKALKVFYLYSHTTLDDFELSVLTHSKQTSVGKRRGELERCGYVEKAERRKSKSGLTDSTVQAYRITDAGLTFYAREANR